MSYLHDNAVIQLAKATLSDKEFSLISPFLQSYYSLAVDEDLSRYTPHSLFAAAYQHFQLVLSYDGSGDVVQAYNPTSEQHGYHSNISVIDIVAKDRAFLIDSLHMAFAREKIAIQFVTHPIYHLKFAQGRLSSLQQAITSHADNISVSHIEFDRLPDDELQRFKEKITQLLATNQAVNTDWQAMQARIPHIIHTIQNAQNIPQSVEETFETIKFLNWLQHRHFTFLGYREYEFDNNELYRVPQSGLGILRSDGERKPSESFSQLPQHLKDAARRPHLLSFAKSSRLSTIHRPTYMDFIAVKKFDDKGQVVGEHRFLGLLTEEAYRLRPDEIPLLSAKINSVLATANLPIDSYALKSFHYILSKLPRDELFQSDAKRIHRMALSVLRMQERDVLRFFFRKDTFETFIMCYLYVPKARYSPKLQKQFVAYLLNAFNGYDSEFSTVFSEGLPILINVLIRTKSGQMTTFNPADIEADLTAMLFDWGDDTLKHLRAQLGYATGTQRYKQFEQGIPAAYKAHYSPQAATDDLQTLHALADSEETLAVKLSEATDNPRQLQLKLLGRGELPSLSAMMPLLENFGFNIASANPYTFTHREHGAFWLVGFRLSLSKPLAKPLADIAPNFTEALTRTWNAIDESDSFDQLVVSAGLSAGDINILRAISKYMLQAKAPFSNRYVRQAVNHHSDIAGLLLQLFHARMGLGVSAREQKISDLQQAIDDKLTGVSSLDEDRILRWFMTVINAMMRTNFFQRDSDGNHKPYLSFKIASAKIPDLPLPKPLYEIFVYAADVEAIHLRGGKVARGGLRWSDRVEDFRTEILGLVKAQIVKNAVIVPVGSKGGFIVKRPPKNDVPNHREALINEGIRCYKIFMRGLLDITDNIVGGNIVPPNDVYRHDDDDPYLVVAADKGTATFSDIANEMAAEYGFWLGDAFASGGSVGYDHKGMGITAKGAWESVKRHFRHLGKDIQKETFTVIGIGDMGGDVFGNGMLLSDKIQLTAAFNHLHIFIDPTPDAASTFKERQRLFETPRSTWEDFDKSLISQGGGVFSRSEKSIAITPEMQKTFAINADNLSPTQLMHALLKAPVELLWNGGIGTYVKAERETHAQVGDKANDNLRVNGCELRCQVIGEGGNLGMTQLGRVEFAQNGGRVLTDAIDNSAGVNCSDHEVNIKILLNQAVESGEINLAERNTLLESMTDEVGELVLRQNYQQPQAISIAEANQSSFVDHIRIIRHLEKTGRLNRELEYLPDDKALKRRLENGETLYAPELAVMLAYSKIQLFEELIASDLPDASVFQQELSLYFPSALHDKYLPAMQTHRLRREIIATFVTNSILNHMGSVFIHRSKEVTGLDSNYIVLAYCAARHILGARDYWQQIDALDNRIAADLQNTLHLQVRATLEQFAMWFLNHRRDDLDIETLQTDFGNLSTVVQWFPKRLPETTVATCEKSINTWVKQGVPEPLAHDLAYMPHWDSALDIIALANRSQATSKPPIKRLASLYFAIADVLDARWLLRSIESLYDNNYWQRRACYSLTTTLKKTIVAATEQAASLDETPEKALIKWQEKFAGRLDGYRRCLSEIQTDDVDVSRLSVAIGEMSALVVP